MPYGFITNLLKENISVCPWITRYQIMNRWRSQVYWIVPIVIAIVPATTDGIATVGPVTILPPESPTKMLIPSDLVVYFTPQPGRPTRTTKNLKKTNKMVLVSTIDKITVVFDKEMKDAKKNENNMKRGRLDKIIDKI